MTTRIGSGVYRIEHNGRSEIIYVAGSRSDRWVFWNGQVFHEPSNAAESDETRPLDRRRAAGAVRTLTAPMPARVTKVLVEPGAQVKKGDTLIILEAMKMELPIRSPEDAAVKAIHCREGQLVPGDALLVELS